MMATGFHRACCCPTGQEGVYEAVECFTSISTVYVTAAQYAQYGEGTVFAANGRCYSLTDTLVEFGSPVIDLSQVPIYPTCLDCVGEPEGGNPAEHCANWHYPEDCQEWIYISVGENVHEDWLGEYQWTAKVAGFFPCQLYDLSSDYYASDENSEDPVTGYVEVSVTHPEGNWVTRAEFPNEEHSSWYLRGHYWCGYIEDEPYSYFQMDHRIQATNPENHDLSVICAASCVYRGSLPFQVDENCPRSEAMEFYTHLGGEQNWENTPAVVYA